MEIDRRSFTRALVAGAGAGLAAAPTAFAQVLSPQAAQADQVGQVGQAAQAAQAEGGMRAGKVFTSTNSATGNELLITGAGLAGSPVLLGRLQTLGLGSGDGLGSQGAVTLSSDGRWLFVVNAGSQSVSVFEVHASALGLVSVHDSGGQRPISVAEHEGLVYVLNAGSNGNVAGYENRRGHLVPVAGSVRPLSAAGGTAPAQISIGTEGDVLVVTEKNTNRLTTYALGEDGRAGKPVFTTSSGATPFGFAFDRRNHLLVSEAGASTLSTYRFDDRAPAKPLLVSASLPTGQAAACWAAVTPNGRFIYTGNAGGNSLSLYALDRNGVAKLLASVAAGTGGGGAGDIAIANHGRTLSVLAPRTPAILNFAIAEDGALAPTGTVPGLPAGVVGLAAN